MKGSLAKIFVNPHRCRIYPSLHKYYFHCFFGFSMNTPLTKSLTKGHFFLQLESHVFGSHRPVPQDVYARLKALEERVLFLEGVSPENFSVTTNLLKSSQCDGDDDDVANFVLLLIVFSSLTPLDRSAFPCYPAPVHLSCFPAVFVCIPEDRLCQVQPYARCTSAVGSRLYTSFHSKQI